MAVLETSYKDQEVMEDIRQTRPWADYLRDKGWRVVKINSQDGRHKMNAFLVPLKLFGLTMMKLQRSEYDPNWTDLVKIKRKYRVVSSVIEPLRVQDILGYRMAGYKLSRFPYLATATYLIDLSQSKDVLWRGMSENARRQITKNKDLKTRETDINLFFRLWKENTKVWTLSKSELLSLVKKFSGKAKTMTITSGDTVHSGLLVIHTKDTANYYQTWTSKAGRKSGAHYKLVWDEILRAKKNNLKWFDLEGVYDNRWPQKRWLGFTEFKRRFGGKLTQLPGSYFRWL